MSAPVGAASDGVEAILRAGRTDITTVYVSFSARHPEGRDAEYIEWHGLDHQPEQHRMASLRASLRLVSSAACREARVVSAGRYDQVDHVMTYMFAGTEGLDAFNRLNVALTEHGRNPYNQGKPIETPIPGMPLIERAAYRLEGRAAAPRVKAGADVLVWRPARGVFLIVERGAEPAGHLVEVGGVAGAWWAAGMGLGAPYSNTDDAGLQVTYCFLDGDPVEVAGRLRPALESRWEQGGVEPLLAAPFHTVTPYQWGRHLP